MMAILAPVASANHGGRSGNTPPINSDNNPCKDAIRGEREERVSPYRNNPILGFPGGIYVPVYDSAVESGINDLGGILDEIGGELVEVQELLAANELAVRQAQIYLRLLCEKEYEEDHTLQHAWADLIGEFVNETLRFVHQGFNGNPAFITNQPAYYQLVNLSVTRVFLQDVVDSDMGTSTKRTIIENVTKDLFAYDFPYDQASTPKNIILSADDIPEDLAEEFYINGGYKTMGEFILNESGSDEATTLMKALTALERRRANQLQYEQEKLNWGRGFFSYEVCDLRLFNDVEEDRRNCRISTPGSVIQDETSFVFGSALRQMEINDEYEEWIAPNTLAVLNDILSYRGLNNYETRNPNPAMSVPAADRESAGFSAAPPDDLEDLDINGLTGANPANKDGPLPREFSQVLDVVLFSAGVDTSIGIAALFPDFLDSDCFLDSIEDPVPASCLD